MFVRVLQLIAVALYIVGAIAVVAYLGYSVFWLIPVLAPAVYFLFTLPEVPGPGAKLRPIGEAGYLLTDEQADYLKDQKKLILCSHLRPIEAAWRSQGVRLWPQTDGSVRSPLNIDWPAVKERFQLPETVIYEEFPGDRFGPPTQQLYCTLCRSRLESA